MCALALDGAESAVSSLSQLRTNSRSPFGHACLCLQRLCTMGFPDLISRIQCCRAEEQFYSKSDIGLQWGSRALHVRIDIVYSSQVCERYIVITVLCSDIKVSCHMGGGILIQLRRLSFPF